MQVPSLSVMVSRESLKTKLRLTRKLLWQRMNVSGTKVWNLVSDMVTGTISSEMPEAEAIPSETSSLLMAFG